MAKICSNKEHQEEGYLAKICSNKEHQEEWYTINMYQRKNTKRGLHNKHV